MFKSLIQFSSTIKKLSKLRSHHDWNLLTQQTNFLPMSCSATQRLWHAVNDKWDVPLCRVCNKQGCRWNKMNGGSYRPTCGAECSRIDPTRTQNIKNTNLAKYGCISAFGSVDVRNKANNTVRQRYGVDNVSQDNKINKKRKQSLIRTKNKHLDKASQISQLISKGATQQQIGDAIGISQPRVSHLLPKLQLQTINNTTSVIQQEITTFIKHSYTGDVIVNDNTTIKPQQLDIVVPQKSIAFEINGVFWHSELSGRSKKYHIGKTIEAKKQNLKLIHIFSNEWVYKRDIVKSRILAVLGVTSKLHARKCVSKTIDSITAHKFCEENHLQGGRHSRFNYGLYHNEELVAVMTFSKHKIHKYELIRFCTKNNHSIAGGASKLFSIFTKTHKPSMVMSYADSRWSTGNVYNRLKFDFIHNTPPNYWYFHRNGDTNKLLSRQQFQKHKLQHKLLHFDNTLTEWNNMKNNGYDRIWDCGSSKWIWQPPAI